MLRDKCPLIKSCLKAASTTTALHARGMNDVVSCMDTNHLSTYCTGSSPSQSYPRNSPENYNSFTLSTST